MKIVYVRGPFLHITVEETFSDLDSIFDEVDMVKGRLKDPQHTGGNIVCEGRTKKKNKGLFLNERKDYQYLKLVSGINGALQRIKHPMVWKNQAIDCMKKLLDGFLTESL